MRPMRWLALLSISACATANWTNYDMDEGVRPAFLRALRGAHGETRLVAGDRFYVIHADALQPEVRAFTSALADTIEETGAKSPPLNCLDQDAAPVVGYSYVDRALLVDRGEVIVRGIRTENGTYYWAEVGRRRGNAVFAEVAGTPAVDRTWQRLVDAASERAATIGSAFLGNWDIDGLGVNVRGTGSGRGP